MLYLWLYEVLFDAQDKVWLRTKNKVSESSINYHFSFPSILRNYTYYFDFSWDRFQGWGRDMRARGLGWDKPNTQAMIFLFMMLLD